MQSWGTQSRFSIRDTGLEPSKSGVIGLVSAALGKPRVERPGDDEHWPTLAELAKLRIGVRVDHPGRMQYDYQTAGGVHRRGDRYGVAKADGSTPQAVTSQRYYLADADFLVGMESEDRALLTRLERALTGPVWPLYLGRKAFPPGEPVTFSGGLREQPLEESLRGHPWKPRSRREKEGVLKALMLNGGVGEPLRTLRLVLDAPYGSTPNVRCDVPLSFAERRFMIRHVRIDQMVLTADLIRE